MIEIRHHGAASDLPINFSSVLVFTHMQVDHVGRIPYMLTAAIEWLIICSETSAIMLPETLEDALKIGFTRDRALLGRVLNLIRFRLVLVRYGEWHGVFDDREYSISVGMQRAGRVLGSPYMECNGICGDSGGRNVFSGDLGAPHAPLLSAPESPERADRLVIESTYGEKGHENREAWRYRVKVYALEAGRGSRVKGSTFVRGCIRSGSAPPTATEPPLKH